MSGHGEAQRQRLLLAALASPTAPLADAVSALAIREAPERAARGLQAYRANAEALAERALGAAFPTVQPLVGDDDFRRLASEFWRAHPPVRGDLAEWGGAFPEWLEAHAAMARWPWLGDCARLDLALHHNERAADAAFDAASLALLETGDPALLAVQFMPGTAVLCSRWPIATIHAAHRAEAALGDDAFAAVREALEAGRGEQVLVVRQGWRAVVHPLSLAEARWSQSLLAGAPLSAALDGAGEAFDFSAWLVAAVQAKWLKGVALLHD